MKMRMRTRKTNDVCGDIGLIITPCRDRFYIIE